MDPLGVGIVGCGNISDQYLRHLATFPDVQVLFCADIDTERAKAQAAAYDVPAAGSVQQALEHPGVELVVNLTIPAAHAEVASAAIAVGKHVWNEKPLAPDVASGRALLGQARQAGLRIGCAPDTVLGAGLQSARRLISAGAIGTPAERAHPAAGPRPGVVAPGSGVPVRERRGPAVRPRAVLPVGAGDAVRAGDQSRRRRAQGARHPRDRLRAASGY